MHQQRFSQNPGYLLNMASKLNHILLITSNSFLSFANLHSSEENTGFAAFVVKQAVATERKDYIQQEGEVLGNLLTLAEQLRPYVDNFYQRYPNLRELGLNETTTVGETNSEQYPGIVSALHHLCYREGLGTCESEHHRNIERSLCITVRAYSEDR